MEEKKALSIEEKRKLLFFLKINAQMGSLRDRSLLKKLKKEIAKEIVIKSTPSE